MDNELYHYGVKGQKWGVRKERTYKFERDGGIVRSKSNTYADRVHDRMRGEFSKNTYADKVRDRMRGEIPKKNHRMKGEIKNANKRSDWSDDARTAHDIKRKKVKQMSNAELKKLNERTRLEQEYSRLNPNAVSKGWKYVAAGAAATGTVVGLYNNSQTLIKIGKQIVDKAR